LRLVSNSTLIHAWQISGWRFGIPPGQIWSAASVLCSQIPVLRILHRLFRIPNVHSTSLLRRYSSQCEKRISDLFDESL
jgi:hypothetical protein